MQTVKIRLITATVLFILIGIVCVFISIDEKSILIISSLDVDANISNEEILSQELPYTDIKTESSILFSYDDYFYTDTIMLELRAENSEIAGIYYTLDSTLPDSENGTLYTNALELNGSDSDQPNCYTVKACGKKADGTYTKVYTHSYFIGKKVYERFNTLVFSLSTDRYNLYDYEYGIFVGGKLRDEYMDKTGDRNPDPPAPANYNMRGMESERPVYVEVFDQSGNLLISQNAGMRTHGGWSRAMVQHSIKLFARKEYDTEKNDFNYSFFPENRDYNNITINKYKRIVLRNNANDNPFAFLRDETIQSLAEKTDLQDTQKAAPAAVFLNGEYYGFVWVHEVYDDNYLDDKNGIKGGEWAILSGGENFKEDDENDVLNPDASADYNDVYSYSAKDLTDDELFKELCSRIDITNFLTYYAVQIYVANGDWPSGNYKTYRYFGTVEENLSGNSTADGKWRWLIYDTDFGMGLYDCKPWEQSLGILLGQHGNDREKNSLLLNAVLMRDDMKEKFIGIMCDLMNYQFSPKNVMNKAREKEEERLQELTYNFKFGGFQLKNTWSSLWIVSNEVNKVIDFGIERPIEMRKQIVKYLNVDNSGYTVFVKQNENAKIKINSCLVDEQTGDFEGFYFNINTVKITAQPIIGYEFSHWLVNGTAVYSNEVTLSVKDSISDKLNIELVTVRASGNEIPVIKMIDYESGMDFIQICNPYISNINLKKFYISDDTSTPFKQILADYILKPGETLNLYCKNYNTPDALGGFLLGFSLKSGETLYITNANGDTVESVYLPKIENDNVYVRNLLTGDFYDLLRSKYLTQN